MKKKAKVKAKTKGTFWKGLLAGGAVAGGAVYFLPVLQQAIKSEPEPTDPAAPKAQVVPEKKSATGPRAVGQAEPEAKPVARPKILAAPQVPAVGGIPLFRRPDLAVKLPLRFGMGESYAGSLAWKKADALGWNSFAIVTLGKPGQGKEGEADNSVTCLFESQSGERVEVLRLAANVFGSRGEPETIAKYKVVCLGFLSEAACPVTKQILDAIGGVEGLKTESPEGFFELKKTLVAAGYRWELTIRSK